MKDQEFTASIGSPESIAYDPPILRLPAELLSEIFLKCLWAYPAGMNPRLDRPPWVFGKICRRWRAVCLSTPALWVNLPRLYTNNAQSRDLVFQGLLKTSLTLSAPMPLLIDLVAYSSSFSDEKISLLTELTPHLPRCSELILSTNGAALPKLAVKSRNFHLLKSLKLRFYGPLEDFEETKAVNFFKEASELQEISLTNDLPEPATISQPDPGPFVFGWLKLPWLKLTSFTGTYIYDYYSLEVLRNSPSLQELSLTATWTVSTEVVPRPCPDAVIHGNLIHLTLIYKTFQHAEEKLPTALVGLLTLPALKHLHVRYEDDHIDSIISLIERSGCSLTTLITHADIRARGAELFAITSQVRYLEICNPSSQSLRDMTLDPDKSTSLSLPHLRHLKVVHPDHLSSPIIDFIKSRTFDRGLYNSSIDPLEAMSLRFGDGDDYWKMYYQLEGWDGGPQQDKSYRDLLRSKRKLDDVLANMNHLNSAQVSVFGQVITDIEESRHTHVRYVENSKIYDVLSKILLHLERQTSETKFNSLIKRIQPILVGWEKSLKDYLGSQRWRHVDPQSGLHELVYVTGIPSVRDEFTQCSPTFQQSGSIRRKPRFSHESRPWDF